MERTDMTKIRDIIRLDEAKLSQRAIASAINTGLGTVSRVLIKAHEAGLSWPLPETLTNAALKAVIYPDKEKAPSSRLEPDWEKIASQIGRSGKKRAASVTRSLLYIEYCDDARAQGLTAYSRSRFFTLLKTYQKGPGAKPEMRFEYPPGQVFYSDFSGKTLPLHTRSGTELVEILVGVLPCSSKIYACAVPNQSLQSWTGAHRAAFEYFGGVPHKTICDNLLAAVTKWVDGEPVLNRSFAEFANHYGTVVLPARIAKPRDKGAVEEAVGTVQTRILAALRHQRFFSLAEMNSAIRSQLETLNSAVMAKYGASRQDRFTATDGPELKALPAQPWVYGETFRRKVGRNYHVQVDHNFYSLPVALLGQVVNVRVSDTVVEIYMHAEHVLVATHTRQRGRGRYATTPAHMPSEHREMKQRQKPNYGDWLLGELTRIGPTAQAWAERSLARRDFPEQAFKSLRGALRLAQTCEVQSFEAACAAAIAAERYGSGFLKDWLKRPVEPEPGSTDQEWLPDHEHIRGSAYYGAIAPWC